MICQHVEISRLHVYDMLLREPRKGTVFFLSCDVSISIKYKSKNVTNFLRLKISYIYLGNFVCVCVCVCVTTQFVSERSAILLVLVIKLTKEMRRRVWRGRD
jgi:hypothetical protein